MKFIVVFLGGRGGEGIYLSRVMAHIRINFKCFRMEEKGKIVSCRQSRGWTWVIGGRGGKP